MVIKSTAERSLAVFIDFENLALGFQGRSDRFDIRLVLKRLLEKGKLVAKKAYADWNRFSSFTASLHEAAIELVEIPRRGQTGKNSADIRLCVDAMDLAYSKEHIDTFVVVSGDSDFSPLVSKLKELGKHVIGLGMSTSTSNLLRDNCDEFIYYEDLTQDVSIDTMVQTELPDAKRKAFMLLVNAATALRRENKEILHSSMIKDTMRRMKPSFNETYHGYRTFSALLEDAQREGLVTLETDKKSGTYVVTHFGSEIDGTRPMSAAPRQQPASNGGGYRNGPPRHQPAARAQPPAAPAQADHSPSRPEAEAQALVEGAAELAAEVAADDKGGERPPSRNRRRRGGRGRRRNGDGAANGQQPMGESTTSELTADDRPVAADLPPPAPEAPRPPRQGNGRAPEAPRPAAAQAPEAARRAESQDSRATEPAASAGSKAPEAPRPAEAQRPDEAPQAQGRPASGRGGTRAPSPRSAASPARSPRPSPATRKAEGAEPAGSEKVMTVARARPQPTPAGETAAPANGEVATDREPNGSENGSAAAPAKKRKSRGGRGRSGRGKTKASASDSGKDSPEE